MTPSRMWIRGSSRFCFATWIVAASRRFNDSESVTCASESRSASIAARSAGAWAARRWARPMSRASSTSDRRMVQLYPATPVRVRPRDSHPEGWARRNTVLKHTRVLQDSAVPSPRFSVGNFGGTPDLPRLSEVRREPQVDVWAAGRPGGRIGERRRDPEPDLQQEVVIDGVVSGQFRTRGAEPREARCLPGIPRVARIAEQVEPQLVRAERKVAERRADERERQAILDAQRRGPLAQQLAVAVAAHRKIARPPERRLAERQDVAARRHAPRLQELTQRPARDAG